MVSPLPPPPGGMETWTQILCDRGLPAPFAFELVDTKAFRERPQARARLNLGEVRRNLSILARIRRALASGRFSLMHLNCALTPTGAPRNLAAALLARRAGVPYVVHLHGTFSVPSGGGPVARFYRRAYRAIFSGAAAILALGKPSYESVLELGDFAGRTPAADAQLRRFSARSEWRSSRAAPEPSDDLLFGRIHRGEGRRHDSGGGGASARRRFPADWGTDPIRCGRSCGGASGSAAWRGSSGSAARSRTAR